MRKTEETALELLSLFVLEVIAGVQWALNRTNATRRPSVLSASLHYPPNDALDAAVAAVVNAGVIFVASAGNDNACAVLSNVCHFLLM